MARREEQRHGTDTGVPTGDPSVASWRRDFEDLGLSPYEARVLVAVLQLGVASTSEITRVAQIPRTSAYQVLEGLNAKGLAIRSPGAGRATWTTPGPDEVLDRCESAREEDLQRYRARLAEVRKSLAAIDATRPSGALPFAQLMRTAAELWRTYNRLLGEAKSELLMFTRSPFVAAGKVNPSVIEALDRGVEMRVVYWAKDLEEASPEWRQELDAYDAAGVVARVADQLPIKLMVFDRSACLVGMPDPLDPGTEYPTFVLIDHPGFAAVQAGAFEQAWMSSTPYQPGSCRSV